MSKIVECVPNFSEGRNMQIISGITDTIESVEGAELKDVDPGAATNRTVVTIVGEPEALIEAAFRAIEKAAKLIDMRKHSGEHPRFGATDVCPFVPVEGVTMDDCVELAKRLGKRVGEELKIPVYLYENAARNEKRRNLAYVRRGEYEGLPEKLADPAMKPDYGPAEFNERAGAIAIGAREFLIAYNITLNSTNAKHATDIAFELREKGRSARTGNIEPFYFNGKLVKYRENHFPCVECDFVAESLDALEAHYLETHEYSIIELLAEHGTFPEDIIGRSAKVPGIFKHCKAIGWFVEEYGRAQISINLTNYKITPPHIVLEKARELAHKRGLVITGSEIVGLVPYQAMVMAGKFYLEKQGSSTGLPPKDIIETAIYSMGLNDVSHFDPAEKILGMPDVAEGSLIALSAKGFIDEVSRPSPAPGGGSVAALSGAIGSALASMVANLTSQKVLGEKFDTVVKIADRAQEVKELLSVAVDADTQAFNDYLDAMRLPKDTPEEKQIRDEAIQRGLKTAIRVPLSTAELSLEAMELSVEIAKIGNKASVSDAGVGAQAGYCGVMGGVLNVLINLHDITDGEFAGEMKARCAALESRAGELLGSAMKAVKETISGL
ncbi:MAG TPA: glutamate formimidoyltransferase [candidate division Zixibacteria bacterium]|nr:glutamate formimidoyltransferase [candidate division Zixibacteria bacterium]